MRLAAPHVFRAIPRSAKPQGTLASFFILDFRGIAPPRHATTFRPRKWRERESCYYRLLIRMARSASSMDFPPSYWASSRIRRNRGIRAKRGPGLRKWRFFGWLRPPTTRLTMEAYSRDRTATTQREFATDKDAIWGGCCRAPIGNRIAHAADALIWVTLTPDKPNDDAITLAGCIPCPYDAYESFAPDGAKYEPRGEPPRTIGLFARAAKRRNGPPPYFQGWITTVGG